MMITYSRSLLSLNINHKRSNIQSNTTHHNNNNIAQVLEFSSSSSSSKITTITKGHTYIRYAGVFPTQPERWSFPNSARTMPIPSPPTGKDYQCRMTTTFQKVANNSTTNIAIKKRCFKTNKKITTNSMQTEISLKEPIYISS